jgi:hypothetical protein
VNPGLQGEKPATNRLSYGTAKLQMLSQSHDRYMNSCEDEDVSNKHELIEPFHFASLKPFSFDSFFFHKGNKNQRCKKDEVTGGWRKLHIQHFGWEA